MAELTIPLTLGYLLPSFVAIVRGHQSWWAIVACNLLLGWTVVGWIFAFGWSLTARQPATTVRERFYGGEEAGADRQRSARS